MNGIINVYKEKGFTSFDVCAKLRGILKQRKIGHTGTLDPDAEGVLPVCIGNATKMCDMLTDKDKVYETVMLLGVSTDTQDITGKVLKEAPLHAGEEEVKQAILHFIGTYDQIPPMYSAIKINGKKLYELARQGIEVERKARRVTIFDIEILSMTMDVDNPSAVKEVRMRVHCSKGTYIRSLCEDIGNYISTPACMKELLRTKVSIFTLENSKRLDEIEQYVKDGNLEEICLPVDTLFEQHKKLFVKKEFDKLVYNGNQLREEHVCSEHVSNEHVCSEDARETVVQGMVRIYDSSQVFVGLYEYDCEKRCYKPLKMFLN